MINSWQEQDMFPCVGEKGCVSPAKPKPGQCIIPLPDKPTCTPVEAARCLGVTSRQIRHWVQEGVLLAIDSSRMPITGKRETGKLRRWRIVVHRADESITADNDFLTLAELLPRITNKEID